MIFSNEIPPHTFTPLPGGKGPIWQGGVLAAFRPKRSNGGARYTGRLHSGETWGMGRANGKCWESGGLKQTSFIGDGENYRIFDDF